MDPFVRNMPDRFGGLQYQDVTNIHPLTIAVILILGIVLLSVSRRWSVLPILGVACFIPLAQKITILSMDFNILRIMVLLGFLRLIFRKEYQLKWNKLDTAMTLWTVSFMLLFIVQQGFSVGAIINRLGFGFDAFGMYFLFRCLIRNWEDVDHIVLGIILISIPVALFFILENRTGRNLFSVFGGVRSITVERFGRLRCQGAYAHPIMAGCFWASLMPLCAAYGWKSAKGRVWASVGLVNSLIIVICSASSTPILALLTGMVGGGMFFLRHYMRLVRWIILISLVALHIVMEGPVWHLISRISAVGGSTGYFRYLLIDRAIRHFDEWMLFGTQSTAHWFFGAQDMCNYYIYQGVKAGFLTLCIFIAVITIAYGGVGRLWRLQKQNRYRLMMSWAMGVCIFIHCANFIGIAYIGTITILWFLILGIIGSLSPLAKPVGKRRKVKGGPRTRLGRTSHKVQRRR